MTSNFLRYANTFLSGLWLSRTSEAGCVASASMAKVSLMRLIYRSCTALRADCSDCAARAVTNVITTVVMLVLI